MSQEKDDGNSDDPSQSSADDSSDDPFQSSDDGSPYDQQIEKAKRLVSVGKSKHQGVVKKHLDDLREKTKKTDPYASTCVALEDDGTPEGLKKAIDIANTHAHNEKSKGNNSVDDGPPDFDFV